MNLDFNGIASRLNAGERQRLQAICTPIELGKGQRLEPAGGPKPAHPVYFLHGATASLWIEPGAGLKPVAVALVGCEGMVGCSQLLETGHSQWSARVLTPGTASMTSVAQLQTLMVDAPALVLAISEFLWQQTQEVAQLGARMLVSDVRRRLALWLHLMHYKTGQDRLRMTHDALSDITGIRRVSVTLVAGQLQSEGVIALHRGEVCITDLPALSRIAGLPA